MLSRRVLVGVLALLGWTGFVGCCPPQVEEIIIDNRDAEAEVLAGEWGTADTTDGNGSWGPDFLYHLADRTNIGVVRFTPNIPVTGSYTVFIYWSADPNRTTDQPLVVHDATGDTTHHVNLQQHGNQWFELGAHVFSAGTAGYIEFNTDTDDGYCNADAARLVPNF